MKTREYNKDTNIVEDDPVWEQPNKIKKLEMPIEEVDEWIELMSRIYGKVNEIIDFINDFENPEKPRLWEYMVMKNLKENLINKKPK